MKLAVPILLAFLAASAGITLASANGYGPLAYISYHIKSTNQSAQIIAANIDLGNLTAGQKGSITANSTINIDKNGTYEIKLLHHEKLEKVFSSFNVTLKIGNQTLNLNLEHDEVKINLNKGTYIVMITIEYQVKQNPKGDLTVKNEPLLVIHPEDNEEED